MLPEFKSFRKIEYVDALQISITQKIHGSNGQIMVYYKEDGTLDAIAGSRTKWLTIDNDNYGFCAFVEKNKESLIKFLGKGRHFGEWAGGDICSGEGLKEKTFVLFQWQSFIGRPRESFPPNVRCVPLLFSNFYDGVLPNFGHYGGNNLSQYIDCTMALLRNYGSCLVPGFMKVEGIVVNINGIKFKEVFNPQEVQWKKEKIHKERKQLLDISHLLQEVRLEKLLSRDEKYAREYPQSLKDVCSDYVKDVEEELFPEVPAEDIKDIKKALGKKMFMFVKKYMERKNEICY